MATISFEYDCDMAGGFVMDPNEQKRIGYITALNGFGLAEPLVQDLTVSLPFNKQGGPSVKSLNYVAPTPDKPLGAVKVVGVLDKFSWEGGVCDPIKLDFYVSQDNAMQIVSLQHRALKTTNVTVAWWIADYDQEDKKWFEQAYPINSLGGGIAGNINGRDDPELDVTLEPEQVKNGVDVNVYKVELSVVPSGVKKYKLHFASSSDQNVVRVWGIILGQT
jgi:hypothetical protein